MRRIGTQTSKAATGDCAICLSSLEGGSAIVRLDCGHDLHESCISLLRGHANSVGSYQNKATCPLCRRPLDYVNDPEDLVGRISDSTDVQGAVDAARALGRSPEQAVSCVGSLASRIQDDNIDLKRMCVWALTQVSTIEHATPMCADPLVRCLGDLDGGVRFLAQRALQKMGRPGAMALAVRIVRPSCERVQQEALCVLAEMEFLGAQVLAEFLEDSEVEVRLGAVKALGRMGDIGGAHAAKVAARLRDEHCQVRHQALLAMGRFNIMDSAPHVSEIASCLRDTDSEIRGAACDILGHLGSYSHEFASPLVEIICSDLENALVQTSAAEAISRISVATASVRRLQELNPRSESSVVINDIFSISLPDMCKASLGMLVVDSTTEVLDRIISALKRMGGIGACVLASQLGERDIMVRGACLDALRSLGIVGAAALAGALSDEDSMVRVVAARSLGRMDSDALWHCTAIATLKNRDPDMQVREVATEALQYIDEGLGASVTPIGRVGEELAAACAKEIRLIQKQVRVLRESKEASLRVARSTSGLLCRILLFPHRCLASGLCSVE